MVQRTWTLVAKDTVQSKRRVGATLLKELSRLISSPHSAACCLCNGEEPLDASENAPAVVDNWEFTMWAGRSTQSPARSVRAMESIADGRRMSSGVHRGFSCGQAAVIFRSLHSGGQRRNCALGDSHLLCFPLPPCPWIVLSCLACSLWMLVFSQLVKQQPRT